jgi:hypothetical protein
MAVTVQNVIDEAEKDLKDAGNNRWKAADLLVTFNEGMIDLFNRLPESFYVNGFVTTEPADAVATDNISFRTKYRRAIVHYILWKSYMIDGEDTENIRLAREHERNYFQEIKS